MDFTTHETLGPVRISVRELGPWPDVQVGTTIGLMRDRAKADAGNDEFKDWAWRVCGIGDDVEKIGRAFDHVKGAMRFQRDEATAAQLAGVDASDVVEVVIRPLDIKRYIEQGKAIGDCDDFSSYLAALLEACGVPCSFCTVAADGNAPYQFSHVYVVAYPEVDGVRVRMPLDASHGTMPGWEAEQVVSVSRKQEWSVGGAVGWLLEAVGIAAVGLVIWKLAGEASKQ
jgi:hypothetical protein